jgi:hypothetical protein
VSFQKDKRQKNMSGRFSRFAAIDWSGAKGNKHAGIALAVCEEGCSAPALVPPPARHWSRADIVDWVLAQKDDILIGFDFSFAPPSIARGGFLPGDIIPSTAKAFWAYVDALCDDEDLGAASFIERHHRRHFYLGSADGIKAEFMHHRVCEAHYIAGGGGKPSTIFDAIGAAQVAKASFAGMRLLHRINTRCSVWPFDPVPERGPCVVEIYTSIAARAAGLRKGLSKIRTAEALDIALATFNSESHAPLAKYIDHATDAILTSAWLRAHQHQNSFWSPLPLTKEIAITEGWTFGVV